MSELRMSVYANERDNDGKVRDTHLLRSVVMVRGTDDPNDPAYHLLYEKGDTDDRDTFIEIAEFAEFDAKHAMSVPAETSTKQ